MAAALVATAVFAGLPGAARSGAPTGEEVLRPGPFGVGHLGTDEPLRLEDRLRDRSFRVEIWYPAPPPPSADSGALLEEIEGAPVERAGAPYPLIVYAHGFSSFASEGALLNRRLASRGYVVIAPEFPFTSLGAPGGPDLFDVINQPGDVSFAIDQMLEWSRFPGHRFQGAVDSTRIGVGGLSLGGLTTLLVAYHPELRDPRLRAALAVAAPAGFFGRAFFDPTDVPLMLVAGDRDAIVSFEHNSLLAYERARPPKLLVTLHGASHTGFASIAADLFEEAENPDAVGCALLAETLPDDLDQQLSQPELVEALGGADAGILPLTDAPLPCSGELAELLELRSMRPSRQQRLLALAALPFFDRFLAGAPARATAFLAHTLDAESPDLTLCRNGKPCPPPEQDSPLRSGRAGASHGGVPEQAGPQVRPRAPSDRSDSGRFR